MELTEMTWPAVAGLSRTTPIVFPIAALEQHGRHMPLFTDSLLLGEVIRRVKETPIAQQVLFAPLQWLGNSDHHLDFPGTLSASPRVYLDLLKDNVRCFLQHGFTRYVFVNGHGGNIVPCQQALFELRQEYRHRRDLLLVSLTYWDSAGDVAGTWPTFTWSQERMGHACEWETSMMLRLRPELVVEPVSEVADVGFGRAFSPGHRAWVMPDRSEPGHIGAPAAASAEKGEALFNLFAQGVARFLERVVAWDGERWDA